MNIYSNKRLMGRVINNNVNEWNKKKKIYNNQMLKIDSLLGEE